VEGQDVRRFSLKSMVFGMIKEKISTVTLQHRLWCPYCKSVQIFILTQSEGIPAKYVCQGCIEKSKVNILQFYYDLKETEEKK